MAKILKRPDVSRFNVSDHILFHKISFEICTKNEQQINAPALITEYSRTVYQEDTSYKWLQKSMFTSKKAATDLDRDKTYTGLKNIVRINLQHFDLAVHDAANHVYNLLESYGNMIRMNYDAETMCIDSIITRLRSNDYLPAATLLGIIPWMEKLEILNNLFKTYVDNVTQEQLGKPNVPAKIARHETDESLRAIVDRVESLANLNGPEIYIPFADEYNVLVKHYNTLVHEHYGRLHARIDIAPATIDFIRTQSFTGMPVFVIPVVNLKKTEKDSDTLIFSEDFSVAYRNNVERGTATLIIRGIGKYKGEIITTFNIN
jgi:hypothetical protein